MPKPSARPSSWLPKQMPKNGIRASSTSRSTATSASAVAGSPGPLEKKTPSGPPRDRADLRRSVDVAGSTCTSMPRCGQRGRGHRLDAEVEGGDGEPLLPQPPARRTAPSWRPRRPGPRRPSPGAAARGEQLAAARPQLDRRRCRRASRPLAQVPGQGAGVDAADPDDALGAQLVLERCARSASSTDAATGRARRSRPPRSGGTRRPRR